MARTNTNSGGGGGSGTVTSVGLSLPAIFSVTGSPVTTSGTLTGSLVSQARNLVLASPNGSSGVPSFRALATGDLPTGTPTEVLYYNNSTGAITSDDGFVRDSTTNDSYLLRLIGGTDPIGYVNANGTGPGGINASYHFYANSTTGLSMYQGVGDFTASGFGSDEASSFCGDGNGNVAAYIQGKDPTFGFINFIQSFNTKLSMTFSGASGTIPLNDTVTDGITGATGVITAKAPGGATLYVQQTGNMSLSFTVGHTITATPSGVTFTLASVSSHTVTSAIDLDNTVAHMSRTGEDGEFRAYQVGTGTIGYKPTLATYIQWPLAQPTGAGQAIISATGSGVLTFGNPTAAAIGTDKQVIFNDGGINAGNANLTYNKTNGEFYVGDPAGIFNKLVSSSVNLINTSTGKSAALSFNGATDDLNLRGTSGAVGFAVNDTGQTAILGDLMGTTSNGNSFLANATSGTNTVQGPLTNIAAKNGNVIASFDTAGGHVVLGGQSTSLANVDIAPTANTINYSSDTQDFLPTLGGSVRIGHLDTASGIVQWGDPDNGNTGTTIGVSVPTQEISFSNSGQTIFQDTSSNKIMQVDGTAVAVKFYGGIRYNVRIVGNDLDDTAADSDYIVEMNPATISVTLTLPAAPSPGQTFLVKNKQVGAGAKDVIVDGDGNTIDGASTDTIAGSATVEQSKTYTFDGTEWSIY